MNNIYIDEQVSVAPYTATDYKFSKQRIRSLCKERDIRSIFNEQISPIWEDYQAHKSPEAENFTWEQFNQLLYSFFRITFDSYICGDLARVDGSHWKSSAHSMDYFIARHNLSHDTFVSFFKAVEQRGGYS